MTPLGPSADIAMIRSDVATLGGLLTDCTANLHDACLMAQNCVAMLGGYHE